MRNGRAEMGGEREGKEGGKSRGTGGKGSGNGHEREKERGKGEERVREKIERGNEEKEGGKREIKRE